MEKIKGCNFESCMQAEMACTNCDCFWKAADKQERRKLSSRFLGLLI